MATYSNKHWLLSHIRNSFISTDETGMCETVMLSDDLPKHFLKGYQTATTNDDSSQPEQTPLASTNTAASKASIETKCQDYPPLRDIDFVCYPGLDLSDDEDIDMSSQSFDIQMYPEVGAHRFRSNTAQKLEKLDIAKRKAARIKNINYNDETHPPDRPDLFVRKPVGASPKHSSVNKAKGQATTTTPANDDEMFNDGVRSQLSLQLAKSPKQVQNKFIEYARFDGTSQMGIQTKRINVFLNMLPEHERNYPLKICVLANAKIIEVIGFVCYKATLQYPDIPLKSVRHYALYMTEDNDDMEDFPPLDNREPCSKFGFSHLTLAERRPLPSVTSVDYHNNLATKSMTSEEDKANLAEQAVRSLQGIELNGGIAESSSTNLSHDNLHDYEERMMNHSDMIEAPMHRTYKLNIIDKPFFKYEVVLEVSGERIEIQQSKNGKFWHKKPIITPIESVAHCEIVEKRLLKATLRIWMKSNSSVATTSCTSAPFGSSPGVSPSISLGCGSTHSPNSPSYYPQSVSPFGFFGSAPTSQMHVKFKSYDFETDLHTAEQIRKKLNCILEMRSSEIRREFLHQRQRKQGKQNKKQLKL